MGGKFKKSNTEISSKDQELKNIIGFDDYPDWAVFKDENGDDQTLRWDEVKKVEDE